MPLNEVEVEPVGSESAGRVRRDLRATLYYLIPSVLANTLPLISMPFVTRELSPADFGLIALGQVFGVAVFGFSNLGLLSVYERNFFQHRGDRQKAAALLWTLWGFVVALGAVLTLVSTALSSLVEQYFLRAPAPTGFIAMVCLTAIFRGANQFGYQYLRNSERPKSFAGISIVEGVLGFALTLLAVVAMKAGVAGAVFAQMVAPLVAGLILVIWLRRELKFSVDLIALRDALKLGSPLTLRVLFGMLGNQIDKYMIGLVSALGQVGIYSIGQRVGQVVYFLMNSMDYVFIPRVYQIMFESREHEVRGDHGSAQGLAVVAGRYLTPFAYATCGLCMIVALSSEEAFLLFTTPEFFEGAYIAPVLCLFYSTLLFGKVNGRQILFAGRSWFSSFMSVVVVGTNLAFYIPMIHFYGATGAAWATLLAGLVYGGISHWQAQKSFRIQWELARLISIYGILTFAILGHLFLLNWKTDYLIRFAFKASVSLGFLLLGWRLGYFRHKWWRPSTVTVFEEMELK